MDAAYQLKIPVSKIARTNNALESFNGHIKNHYFEPYEHSGRLPWIDTWILVLITKVIPDFFQKLYRSQNMKNYYASLRIIKNPVSNNSSSSNSGISQMTGSMIDDGSDFINSSDIDSTSLDAGELINKWTIALNVEDDDAEINIDPPLNIDGAPSNTQELHLIVAGWCMTVL